MKGARGFAIVITTAPTRREANTIADALVSGSLAACVQIVKIDSVYRWKGKVERAPEFMLICKTRASLLDALERRIRSLHSYDVPEMIALPLSKASGDYLEWLGESVKRR